MRNRTLLALCAVLAFAACASDAPQKPPAEVPGIARTGTVGYVSEVKDRGMTGGNWKDAVSGLFKNEYDRDVIRVRYEVTVLYDDHTQGTVQLTEKPDFVVGQRVRVMGSKIEPLRR
jgi:hypothetical protein